jgi:AcrR family transcriptional regulator
VLATAEIVRAARLLVDEEGLDGLTMRSLAGRLGVRAPSLYKHVADKEALELALVVQGIGELAEDLREAHSREPGSLPALGRAYRRYATTHPHLYRLMTEYPLPRDSLQDGLEQRLAAPVVAVVGSPERATVVWAFAHGMAQLELAGRFPPDADLDAAWREGLDSLMGGASRPRAIVRSVKGPD